MKLIAIGLITTWATLGQSAGDAKVLKGEILGIEAPAQARADKGVLMVVQALMGDGTMINLEVKKDTKVEREASKDSRTAAAPTDLMAGQFFEASYTGAITAVEPGSIENVVSFLIKV